MSVTFKDKPMAGEIAELQNLIPTIPDSITAAIMASVGFLTDDPRIIRLISIAAQKFMANVSNSAMERYKKRLALSKPGEASKNRKFFLSMEDLTPVLREHGINSQKPPYFV